MDDKLARRIARALYDNVEEVLPELQTKKRNGRKYSPINLATSVGGNVEYHRTTDKTYINPSGTLYDMAESVGSNLFRLYSELHNLTDKQALVELTERYHIEVELDTLQAYEHELKVQGIRAYAQRLFANAMVEGTPEAVYMIEKRGWSMEQIKRAGIGRVTPEILAQIRAYDTEGILKDEYLPCIGQTHTLSIPRVAGPDITSWNFRNINATDSDKYRASKGERKDTFANIQDKEQGEESIAVIVEGELDALHAKACGIRIRFVASLSDNPSQAQIEDAIKRGYDSFVLLLDHDAPQYDANNRLVIKGDLKAPKVAELIAQLKGTAYIANLPEQYKDTDEYLSNGHDAQDLYQQIRNTMRLYSEERMGKLLAKCPKDRELTAPEYRKFIDEVEHIFTATNFKEHDLLQKMVEKAGVVSTETLTRIVNGVRASNTQQDTLRRAQNTSKELYRALQDNNAEQCARILQDAVDKQATGAGAVKYAKLYTPIQNFDEWEHMLNEIPQGVPTGIIFENQDDLTRTNALSFKEGISLICGATSHGKTTMAINFALNEADRNIAKYKRNGGAEPLKKVIFFTYEMNEARITQNFLKVWKGAEDEHKDNKSENAFTGEHNRRNFFERYIRTGAILILYVDFNEREIIESLKYYTATDKQEPSLILLDYVQCIQAEQGGRARTEEIKQIVNALKNYATEHKIPMPMPTQFNRSINSPCDLLCSNIGEGGDFERIAVDVVGLFNMKFYDPNRVTSNSDKEKVKHLLDKIGGTLANDVKSQIERIESSGAGKIMHIENGKYYDILYAKLMKSRFGEVGSATLLLMESDTGYIQIPHPELLALTPPLQTEIVEVDNTPQMPTFMKGYGSTDPLNNYYDNPEEMDDFII